MNIGAARETKLRLVQRSPNFLKLPQKVLNQGGNLPLWILFHSFPPIWHVTTPTGVIEDKNHNMISLWNQISYFQRDPLFEIDLCRTKRAKGGKGCSLSFRQKGGVGTWRPGKIMIFTKISHGQDGNVFFLGIFISSNVFFTITIQYTVFVNKNIYHVESTPIWDLSKGWSEHMRTKLPGKGFDAVDNSTEASLILDMSKKWISWQ